MLLLSKNYYDYTKDLISFQAYLRNIYYTSVYEISSRLKEVKAKIYKSMIFNYLENNRTFISKFKSSY